MELWSSCPSLLILTYTLLASAAAGGYGIRCRFIRLCSWSQSALDFFCDRRGSTRFLDQFYITAAQRRDDTEGKCRQTSEASGAADTEAVHLEWKTSHNACKPFFFFFACVEEKNLFHFHRENSSFADRKSPKNMIIMKGRDPKCWMLRASTLCLKGCRRRLLLNTAHWLM